MKCYKVVRKNGDGKFVSCVIPKESAAQVTYPVNREAGAHPIMMLMGNGLCAFDTAQNALDFAKYKVNTQVWLAEGEDQFENLPRIINVDELTGGIIKVAIHAKTKESINDWPEGTLMFRSITLKKCLKII